MTELVAAQADMNRGLFWVKGELGQCLQRVRNQIEAYLESGDDSTRPLEASVADVQELASIAGVIQCYSVQLLADEMLKTLRHVLGQPGDKSEASFSAIVSATLQLADYVELLAHGEIDHPLVFGPIINELRLSRGAKVYSRAALFSRFLELRGLIVQPPPSDRRRSGMSRALAGKHAEVIQKAVQGAISGDNRERSLSVLAKAASQLASVAVDARIYQCWRGVEAMCHVLLHSAEATSAEEQKLLAKVGQCVRAVAANGEKAVSRAAGVLGAQCLQLMTLSDARPPALEAVREEFGLAGAGATETQLQSLRQRLSQPNIESLQTVTREIRHNLHDIKDTIDLALRSGTPPGGSESLIASLHSLGSTLSVLGLDALGQLADQLSRQVTGFQDGGSDEQWMEVAENLIRVEQGLDAELMPSTPAHIVDKTAHQDLREGVGAVLRESLVNITRIKIEVDQYIGKGQDSSLEAARGLLSEIISAFELLSMDEAVSVLGEVRSWLQPERIVLARSRAQVADRLADTVAGVEYYVEAVQEKQPNTERLLADIRNYLQQLEQSVGTAAVVPEEVPEKAPQAAPQDVDPEFRAIFIEESGEVLAELTQLMPRWTQNPSDENLLGEVRRAFHTLKGSGRMVGATDIGEFAWNFEDMLNRCRDGALPLDNSVVELVVQAVKLLPDMVGQLERGQASAEPGRPLIQQVRKLLGVDEEQEIAAEVIQIFIEDASGYLGELEAAIGDSDEVEVTEPLVRLMHSLRGGAAAAGKMSVNQLAEAAENLLQNLRANQQTAPAELLGRLHAAFQAQLQSIREGQEPAPASDLVGVLKDRLDQLRHAGDGVDLELAEIFSEEALGLLEEAEKELLNWRNRPDSNEAEQTLQRIFHTLKGSARTAGAMGLGQVGEALDFLMKGVLAREITDIGPALFDRIGRTVVASYNLLDEFREGRDGDPAPVLQVLEGQATGPELPQAPADAAAGAADAGADAVAPLELAPREGAQDAPTADQPLLPGRDEPDQPDRIEPEEEDFSRIEDDWPPDAEIMELFEAEAQELLESMDRHFSAWEDDLGAQEPLRALQRDLHTFKGGARMAGLHSLGAVAHEMETMFSTMEQDGNTGPGVFGRLHNAIDGLHHLLDGVKAGHRPSGIQDMLDDLRDSSAAPLAPSAVEPVATAPQPAPAPPPAAVVEAVPTPLESEAADAELIEVFLPEGMELMEAFDAAREQLVQDPADASARAEMLRVLHTLKGGARMAGLSMLGDEVHDLESGLEGAAQQGGPVAPAMLEQMQQASDRFHEHLAAAKSGGVVAPRSQGGESETAETADLAEEIPISADIPEPDVEPYEEPAPAPRPRSWSETLQWEAPTDERLAAIRRETARVSVEQLDNMLNEAGEISIYRSRLERQINAFSIQLREVEQTIARIRDQLRSLEGETDAQIQARTAGMQHGEDSDRYGEEFDPLEMDRYSRMQELTRALSESVTDLASLHTSMTDVVSETDTLLLQQGRVNTSVQQGLMSTLMVPFSRQVQRLQRVVRQTANDNGKQVELLMHGIEAEMDRNVLERMTPVIEHVIRNCVIHGLEKPDQRRASGKSETGRVWIRLEREGSKLAIQIRDDGKGLDFDRIRSKAIEKGMMKPDTKVSEAELAQFIFQPGFSTAEALTQDAGRGVGMDVVSAEVKQLGGTLDLDSETGKGARFVIRLPLSLAISQALLVQVGGEVYATPLANIEGIARLPSEELGQFLDDQRSFAYGGQEYRVRYLGQLLGMESQPPAERAYVPVILVHTGEGMGISERRVAVAVDQLLGSRELVTKTAGPQVSTVVGVTGATIQADGRVVLILDVVALVQDRLFKTLQHVSEDGGKQEREAGKPTVMVIDDSITMRRVAERVLTRHGYRVTSAKDGMDGIAQLQADTPDAVLLDIEMPKVDGFEVATFIRNNERLARVPIIMITSRSGDKHRERAAAIGVNRYLIKPYQEQQLISELKDVMTTEA